MTSVTTPVFDGMIALHGKGVAKGIAIGQVVIMGAALLEVEHHLIAHDEIDDECLRVKAALDAVYHELNDIKNNLPPDAPIELEPVLTVHSLLVSDPMLAEETQRIIRERRYNAAWAVSSYGQVLADQFATMDDEYLRERASDINQVIERVLSVLSGSKGFDFACIAEHSTDDLPLIVVAHDISPADMLNLREKHFAAFVTDEGGPTSHTAIVARSMHVPAVVGMKNVRSLVRDRDVVIVDGEAGLVIINPSPLVLKQYQQAQKRLQDERDFLLSQKDALAITQDKTLIELQANIETPEEASLALEMGATGIGLYRTEFLFMNRDTLPDEEEQYQAYANVLKVMGDKPVTIRTLDIGSDKTLNENMTVAVNPALGLRAVRYCLAHPEMFMTQLRALLRASVHGRLKVLVPMISHIHEIEAVKTYIQQAQQSLQEEGLPYGSIKLGAMVEIPATAIAIDSFLAHLDFVSIGTNDLIQYTLAVDRVDHDVADLYDPLHPAVLRLIHQTIEAGARVGKEVSICGEMAGDTAYTTLLLGLGLKSFSMHPRQLPAVKHIIRTSSLRGLQASLAEPIRMGYAIDVNSLAHP